MNETQDYRIVLIVVILCLTSIICVTIYVFGTPLAAGLAQGLFRPTEKEGLALRFKESLQGTGGEEGYPSGVTFVPGYRDSGVLIDGDDILTYRTENNINKDQGAIEFWLKPSWDGGDEQSYVFFETGDTWFNRFRITKDGANNFRFMVWSSDTEYDAACNVGHWTAGDWHHVWVTWQSDTIALYLDHKHCDTQEGVTMPETISSLLFIGSTVNQDMQAQAVIDEFIIRPKP
jgi:hypothetical protein